MCHGQIYIGAIERRYGITFADYFAASLERLQPHVADALVLIECERITATPAGRLLLRAIAMCFDAYLEAPQVLSTAPAFSRVV